MEHIEDICTPLGKHALRRPKAGMKSPLDRIAVVSGPGGFMSLRLSAAIVNTLSWGLGIPVASIHLSDLLFERASTKDVLWMHSTKRELFFMKGFGASASIAPDITTITLSDATALLARLPSPISVIGELLPEQRSALPALSIGELQAYSTMLPAFLAKQTYTQHLVEPWYGRGI